MAETIGAEALVKAIGATRCAEYGIRRLMTYGDSDNGVPGTLIVATVSTKEPDFWPLIQNAPRYCYPVRLVAVLAQLLDALALLEIDIPPSPGEALALAYCMRHQRRSHDFDLLRYVRECEEGPGTYVETPAFPVGLMEVIHNTSKIPAGTKDKPGGQWLIEFLTHYPWFKITVHTRYFDVIVLPEVPEGQPWTPEQLLSAVFMWYGWNNVSRDFDPIVTELAEVLSRDPESSELIPVAA